MEHIGTYYGINTYYLDMSKEDYNTSLPDKNWYCCALANQDIDDSENSVLSKFIRTAIDRDVLVWHGIGNRGEKLHLAFDLLITIMEVDEQHLEIDVCTIGDNETNIANGLWQCYGATCLPERTDYDNLKLICVSFDGHDYRNELRDFIIKFNEGWLPEE